MCSPIAAVGGLMGASTLMGAASAYGQQQAANAAAKYQAKIGEQNARIAERQAQEVERAGFLTESKHRQRVSALQGTQRAGYAGAGVNVLAGTPGAVFEETEVLGDLDALEIKYQTALDAWAMRNQASNMRAQAALAKSSMASPWLSAGGALLGGAARIGGMIASYNASQSAAGGK